MVHPEQVAAYLAKYLSKATEDFGLPARVRSTTHARVVGASAHAVRIVATASRLAGEGEPYARLRDNLATLGYRGHPLTKGTETLAWITSHTFRKTAATILDEAALSARLVPTSWVTRGRR